MSTHEYEFYLMLSGSLDDNSVNRVIKDIESLITKHGGKITQKDLKGRQKLSYIIASNRDAYQVLLSVELDASAVQEVRAQVNLMSDVVRAGIYSLAKA